MSEQPSSPKVDELGRLTSHLAAYCSQLPITTEQFSKILSTVQQAHVLGVQLGIAAMEKAMTESSHRAALGGNQL